MDPDWQDPDPALAKKPDPSLALTKERPRIPMRSDQTELPTKFSLSFSQYQLSKFVGSHLSEGWIRSISEPDPIYQRAGSDLSEPDPICQKAGFDLSEPDPIC